MRQIAREQDPTGAERLGKPCVKLATSVKTKLVRSEAPYLLYSTLADALATGVAEVPIGRKKSVFSNVSLNSNLSAFTNNICRKFLHAHKETVFYINEMSFCPPKKLIGIFDNLREQIAGGSYQKGDRLPTTSELAKAFECSVGMASKAISMLIHEGMVEQRRGLGTRVIKTTGKDHLMQLDAFALIHPGDKHGGYWRMAKGFQDAAQDVNRRVMMLSVGTDFRREAEIVGRLNEFDVKGAVVFPVLPTQKDRLYFAQMLTACNIPVVLADVTLPGFGGPAVMADGFHAGYTMTRHLLAQGLRKIGFLTDYAWVPTIKDRYRGYRWALQEAGIEENPGSVMLDPSAQFDAENPVQNSALSVGKYLETARHLEGVVCSDDFLAMACLASLKKTGIRVPEDLRVVGISDYALSAKCEPPLTTYRVPFERIGQEAFQMLNRLIQGEKPLTTEVLVQGDLVVRKSG